MIERPCTKGRVHNVSFLAWLDYSGSAHSDKATQLYLGFYVGDDIVPGVTEGLSSLFAMAPAQYSPLSWLSALPPCCAQSVRGRSICVGIAQAKQWDVLVVMWLGGDCDGFQLGQWLVSATGLVGGSQVWRMCCWLGWVLLVFVFLLSLQSTFVHGGELADHVDEQYCSWHWLGEAACDNVDLIVDIIQESWAGPLASFLDSDGVAFAEEHCHGSSCCHGEVVVSWNMQVSVSTNASL